VRSFLELFAVIVLGLGLGGALAWLSIQNNNGFGTLKIGQWTAWPLAGSVDADPYSKAKVAADGDVPLGAAEGIAFHATKDDQGKELLRECRYILEGQTPPARLWTLAANEPSGTIIKTRAGQASMLYSRKVLRKNDGSFVLTTGPTLAPKNWLEVTGTGKFELVFRLYDTPITSTSGIVDPQMPSIRLQGCR